VNGSHRVGFVENGFDTDGTFGIPSPHNNNNKSIFSPHFTRTNHGLYIRSNVCLYEICISQATTSIMLWHPSITELVKSYYAHCLTHTALILAVRVQLQPKPLVSYLGNVKLFNLQFEKGVPEVRYGLKPEIASFFSSLGALL